jgi:predicted nucleic acid-binding protein
MNAVDTNVLIYYLDQDEAVKQAKAVSLLNQLWAEPTIPVLLWQVLGETVRHLRAWEYIGRITRQELLGYVVRFRDSQSLVMPTPAVLDTALDLYGRYSLSHWDSMILGACKEAGVTTLYSEDMGAPTTYDGIQLINSFL